MTQHTPEPWATSTKADGNWWHISAGNQAIAAVHAASKKRNEQYAGMFEANARRIVACVNACAGVDTDLLEAGELDKPTMLVIQENKDLKHRCDELLAALEEAKSVLSSINTGRQHKVEVEDDEPAFWQRNEWVTWAKGEILPMIEAAIAKAKGGAAITKITGETK